MQQFNTEEKNNEEMKMNDQNNSQPLASNLSQTRTNPKTQQSKRRKEPSLSPESKRIKESIDSALIKLVETSYPAKYQNPNNYKLGLDAEVAGFNNMKLILDKDFNFETLVGLFRKVLYSQENHNKHLAYLLNKQLTQNNQVFIKHNDIVEKVAITEKRMDNAMLQIKIM